MTKSIRTALVAGVAALCLAAFGLPLVASEQIDYDGINKIKQQGLDPTNSKVMETMSYLTDVYGPRLTGSPNVQKAGDWAVAKMKEWGLVNVSLEPWTACPPDVAATLASGQRAGAPGGAAAVAADAVAATRPAAASRAAGRTRSSISQPSRRSNFRFPARRPAGRLARTAWSAATSCSSPRPRRMSCSRSTPAAS